MENAFAQRLKSIRSKAGLSQQALADRLGITKQAVSKYELGQMLPDSKVLIGLSNLFRVKPDYFFRPLTVSLDQVDFRKKASLKGARLAALKSKIADRLERYLELEELMAAGISFQNPLAGFTLGKARDVEEAAMKLLDDWHLGYNPLPNITQTLERKGVKVVEVDADPDFDGLSTMVQGEIPVIVVNQRLDNVRKRFTVLHELGHLTLPFPEGLPEKEKEHFCHRFAGAVLIPEPVFLHELGPKRQRFSLNELIEVKEYFGISVKSLVYRARDLNVISEVAFRRVFRYVKTHSDQLNEKDWGCFQGKEQSGRFEQLLFKGLAEEIFTIGKAAALANISISELTEKLRLIP